MTFFRSFLIQLFCNPLDFLLFFAFIFGSIQNKIHLKRGLGDMQSRIDEIQIFYFKIKIIQK